MFRLLVTISLAFVFLVSPVQAQAGPDYDLPGGGHFYTQTDGASGVTGTGYAVTNADNVPFWDFFRSAGGVQSVGYPVSHRFRWNGFTVQAFQKVVFQWRPEANAVYYVNVLDEMHNRGFDNYLRADKLVPAEDDWSGDAGLTFAQAAARHLALLDSNAAIAAAYYSEPDSLNRNGLPMAKIQTLGNVIVLRAQRKVYQQWLIDVPFAKAGQVVTANGGDLGKEAGLYPAVTIVPKAASDVPRGVIAEQSGTGATPTPAPTANCNGDETMTFDPATVTVGRQFTINVASARASTNVGLRGPFGPQFQGARTSGPTTIWSWSATPDATGRADFTFTIGNVNCTANGIDVSATNSTPTATPYGPPNATATPRSATPTSTPVATISSSACQGDETMAFDPEFGTINSEYRIEVTSVRPSTNISLRGPFSPQFVGARPGGRGTIWTWRATPNIAGRQNYDFLIGDTVCTSNFVDVRS